MKTPPYFSDGYTQKPSIVHAHLQKQRGDFLLESLIGLVLMALLGMGVIFTTSKVSVSQRDMQMQEIAISQLRAALIKNGTGAIDICTTTPTITLPNQESVTVEVQGCGETTSASINSTSVNGVPKPLNISASSASLGQVVVGGVWEEASEESDDDDDGDDDDD